MISRVKTNTRPGNSVGFSLLELLVVLILLGFMAGVAAPSVGRFMNTLAFKKQISKVMAVMRHARLMAVTKGKPVRMRVLDDSKTLHFSGAFAKDKDLGLGEDGRITMKPEFIKFAPDGHATPGELELRVGGRHQKIIIDSLSGLPVLSLDDDA